MYDKEAMNKTPRVRSRSASPKRKAELVITKVRDVLYEWLGPLLDVKVWVVGGNELEIDWQKLWEAACRSFHATTISYARLVAWLYVNKEFAVLQIVLQCLLNMQKTSPANPDFGMALLTIGAQTHRYALSETQCGILLYKLSNALATGTDFVRIEATRGRVLYSFTEFPTMNSKKWPK